MHHRLGLDLLLPSLFLAACFSPSVPRSVAGCGKLPRGHSFMTQETVGLADIDADGHLDMVLAGSTGLSLVRGR